MPLGGRGLEVAARPGWTRRAAPLSSGSSLMPVAPPRRGATRRRAGRRRGRAARRARRRRSAGRPGCRRSTAPGWSTGVVVLRAGAGEQRDRDGDGAAGRRARADLDGLLLVRPEPDLAGLRRRGASPASSATSRTSTTTHWSRSFATVIGTWPLAPESVTVPRESTRTFARSRSRLASTASSSSVPSVRCVRNARGLGAQLRRRVARRRRRGVVEDAGEGRRCPAERGARRRSARG